MFTLGNFRRFSVLLFACSGFLQSLGAEVSAPHEYRLSVSGGIAGVLDDQQTFYGSSEIRFPAFSPLSLHPALGFGFGEKEAYYLFFDLQRDFFLSPNWVLTPSFGAGFFDGRGKLDLGHKLEFRSAIGLSHQFPNMHRLGVSFSHLSNASLSDHNPGTETISLTYSWPL